ncbi:MAG: response regulator transcription factor [Hyphomicrobiales bacterium]|nr:response regulator transcription factor [Hyphomicrobiales bacterium]
MRILLVEDDEVIGDAVRDHVRESGHAVDWAQDLATARDLAAVADYGLVLLDLSLPDGNGNAFLREFRAGGKQAPVIMLTARDQISHRIEGLNNGADDYLVKPFDLGELTARIGAVARRYSGRPDPTVIVGDIRVDLAARRVARGEGDITLTAREWAVLDRLMARPGAIVSKGQIEDALYAFGAEVESNTVEVYVSRLRRKIGTDLILTVRGVGYRLQTP